MLRVTRSVFAWCCVNPAMGKRSSFPRMKNDTYDTPAEAVTPLLPHLAPATWFVEPCAGSGALVRHLIADGHTCLHAVDIAPRDREERGVERGNALTYRLAETPFLHEAASPPVFITNPPWTRALLHPIILNLFWQAPTWLLLDASWAHTRQAAPYMALCRKIISVGRVRWIMDSAHTGKDDAAWFLFDAPGDGPVFVRRR